MTTTASKRKKYVREVKPTWWKALDFYKFYVLRESTSVPTIWFCLVLFYGLACLGKENGFVENFIPFLQNPLVVVLNIITLGAVLLNSFTFFGMAPQMMNVIVKNERIDVKLVSRVFWGITAFVSLLALILV
ncbi:fumarate reductase subunit FrdC [Glaesserella parasuis]|uniref:Fumarate reductase subunit C n=3 Tax=Glaesserella parasuis TaxID=738 RepID=A0A084EH40_GLAPU|nr:fumarate reductase subunit FrdC [Glaesserella parasuis]AGO16583.1 fumarate reductase (anaerobic), membrane anchor subunit C [Glaesserella parasuis ZJ0906]EPZ99218.1 fumarate reductase membrane protein [Glaesserella parasuis SW114]EQA03869.1 fumarate reductase subunit C [Glaesserella parasuis MN-H]EQA04797.1 fumarate reductase subunit C [Glaesserella parasuis 12939]EQA07054.1 fumarate reductase subunit C [Glaesserella parasuis H465]EQA14982.1 fumarate reductase subunit C [Glaesserella paras